MKHLYITVAVFGLLSASCRKERICDCKTVETEVRIGFGEKTTVEYTSSKLTKQKQKKTAFKAETACFSELYSYPRSGGSGSSAWSSVTTVDTNCELK